MASRLRRPESVRLELTKGDWLLVKKFLTAGDSAFLYKHSTEPLEVGGQKQEAKPEEYGFALCAVYLLDWTMLDYSDQPVHIREDTYDYGCGLEREAAIMAYLKKLPTADYVEILSAIQAHENRVSLELVKEKNGQSGEADSSATSSSAA